MLSKLIDILRSASTLLALALGAAGIATILYVWELPPFRSAVQVTENAYVRGQVTILSPQLSGIIAEVAVQDFQEVKAGQLLVQIDDRIYLQKLAQARATLASQEAALANSEQQRHSAEAKVKSAEAQVASAQVAYDNAQGNWGRIEPLLQRGVTTLSEADKVRTTMEQARAAHSQAEAALEVTRQDLQATIVSRQSLEAAVSGAEAAVNLAEIDLKNTRITAPEDGRLGEIGARLGQYVAPGTQLMALVPKRIWVVANFKETQLSGMQVGQPVSFKVDALGHAELNGRVERFAPATGSEFSVLRPDNATGNFTKVAQRVPVRISIDPDQAMAEKLTPGMSVVVSIDTNSKPLAQTASQ
ncbi:MAG: HlyD family secretion protein [Proteobacteria bacterium]|nr:HlyD family secretion protein [Pseudomonadota bacterium]